MRGVFLEYLIQPLGRRRIQKTERYLVVDLERPVVEIGRADGAPDAVDRHHFLVKQCGGILEEPDAVAQ